MDINHIIFTALLHCDSRRLQNQATGFQRLELEENTASSPCSAAWKQTSGRRRFWKTSKGHVRRKGKGKRGGSVIVVGVIGQQKHLAPLLCKMIDCNIGGTL